MNKSLFSLLEKFTKEEWIRFGEFISSPYFVKGRDYTNLFTFLRVYFQKYQNQDFITNAMAKFRTDNNMTTQALSNRLSELNKLAEKFLIHQNTENDSIGSISILYRELIKRELYSNINITYNNNKDKINITDASDLIPFSSILQSRGFYFRSRNDMQETFNQFDNHVDCLNAYSLDRMLYFATEYHLSDVYGIPYKAGLFLKTFKEINFDKLINRIESENNEIYKSVRLRYYIYNSLTNPDKNGLADKAENYFNMIHENISIDLKIDYFQKMQANYILHINKGEASYLHKVFELFKVRLEDKDTINFSLANYPATEFRDFVIVGLRVKEFDWVENFINDYSNQLNPAFRDEEKTMAIVRLCTERKDFIKALSIFKNYKNSNNHVHNIDMYKYMIIVNYEMKYFDEVRKIIDKLRHYLLKDGLIDIQKEYTKGFIDNIIRIMKIINKGTGEGINEFINDINSNPKSIVDKKWFLEKAEELK